MCLVAQLKNPPAMQKTQEMWVQFLGGEDSLEEGDHMLNLGGALLGA